MQLDIVPTDAKIYVVADRDEGGGSWATSIAERHLARFSKVKVIRVPAS